MITGSARFRFHASSSTWGRSVRARGIDGSTEEARHSPGCEIVPTKLRIVFSAPLATVSTWGHNGSLSFAVCGSYIPETGERALGVGRLDVDLDEFREVYDDIPVNGPSCRSISACLDGERK